MSDIRDKVKALIVQKLDILATSSLINRGAESRYNCEDILANEILCIPGLAVVDRKAKLPVRITGVTTEDETRLHNIEENILKAGWAKEVKE